MAPYTRCNRLPRLTTLNHCHVSKFERALKLLALTLVILGQSTQTSTNARCFLFYPLGRSHVYGIELLTHPCLIVRWLAQGAFFSCSARTLTWMRLCRIMSLRRQTSKRPIRFAE